MMNTTIINNKSSIILSIVLLTFLPTFAISSSHHHHNHHHHHGIKSKHFTLYQHDIFNQTDFILVPGVAGANFSGLAAPFGTLGVLKDNLTLTPDPSSKFIGTCEAFVAVSSFDGLDNLSIIRFVLDLEDGHLSGTVSVVGVINAVNPSDLPVTGGTGDFLLVQGYVTSTFLSSSGLTFIFKVDFHLYWPHYAPYAIKAQ